MHVTRCPVGFADGAWWVLFIAVGQDFLAHLSDPTSRSRDPLFSAFEFFDRDGAALAAERGGGGGDTVQHHLARLTTTASPLTIRYLSDDVVVAEETIHLG